MGIWENAAQHFPRESSDGRFIKNVNLTVCMEPVPVSPLIGIYFLKFKSSLIDLLNKVMGHSKSWLIQAALWQQSIATLSWCFCDRNGFWEQQKTKTRTLCRTLGFWTDTKTFISSLWTFTFLSLIMMTSSWWCSQVQGKGGKMN